MFAEFNLLHRMYEEANNEPELVLYTCRMSIVGKTLAFINTALQAVAIWNVVDATRVTEIRVPGGELRPQSRIYDFSMNSFLIACLWSWSVVVMPFDSENPDSTPPESLESETLPDFEPLPEFDNWLEYHRLEVNEDFIVTQMRRSKIVVWIFKKFCKMQK